MTVRLIAITKPVIPEAQTASDLIAYVARVSNPGNQANSETAPNLLAYLQRNAHWSPFEHASMTLEIETTRDIARQILRHRSFCFQEFSGRYAEMPDAPVYRDARMQDTKNRQNSLLCDNLHVSTPWADDQERVYHMAREIYEQALSSGIAKEVARAVLPEGLTPSRLYMTGSVRSWLHYIAPFEQTQQHKKSTATLPPHVQIFSMNNFRYLSHETKRSRKNHCCPKEKPRYQKSIAHQDQAFRRYGEQAIEVIACRGAY